jgi:hypothetical protein
MDQNETSDVAFVEPGGSLQADAPGRMIGASLPNLRCSNAQPDQISQQPSDQGRAQTHSPP